MHFDWSTFALQTVNFAILVWLLHRFLYKPVLALVDARRAEIDRQFAEVHAAQAQAEVEAATKKATLVPLEVAERAQEVRQIVELLRPMTNPRMASDLTVAVAQANAAVQGALANVEINLGDIKDEVFLADVRKRVAAVLGG